MRHNVKVSISQILKAGTDCLVRIQYSSESFVFNRVSPADLPCSNALHFLGESKLFPSEIPKNSGWIISSSLLNHPRLQEVLSDTQLVAFCESVPEAMSHLLALFDPRQLYDLTDFKNQNGAWVHSTAVIDPSVRIYPGTVIGAGVEIGANSELRPNVTVEPLCTIGKNCLIHAGTVIGSDGFGFFKNLKTSSIFKIPQIGYVMIGNNVEIGSNCSIDRATLTSTVIGENTKLDNLVHLAHNTIVGSNSFLAAGFMCAGSIRLGDNFACGGNVVVSDHITICDNVTIGGRSAVTKDITEPGAYVGYPLQPWNDGLRTINSLTHIAELRKDVSELKKIVKGE